MKLLCFQIKDNIYLAYGYGSMTRRSLLTVEYVCYICISKKHNLMNQISFVTSKRGYALGNTNRY